MHEDGQAYRVTLIGSVQRCEHTYKEGCNTDYDAHWPDLIFLDFVHHLIFDEAQHFGSPVTEWLYLRDPT
jgi:hypothetical protein